MKDKSENRPARADIVALAQRYLDGELTDEQRSTLFDSLRRDEQTQRLFVRSLMQAAYLNELLAQERSDESICDCNLLGPMEASGPLDGSVATPILPPPMDMSDDGACSSSARGWAQLRGWLTGGTGLGVVSVVLVAVVGLALLGRGGNDEFAGRSAAPAPDVDAPVQAPVQVFDPRSIRLDAGSARVTLPKVGYMLVDGPADVELVSPLKATLTRGRIRVRVTEKSGRGFVVETPDGDVVDLSTEFGLSVAEGRKTDVVVFDGAVDLHVGRTEAGGQRRVERLIGGEGVAFNRQGEMDRVVSIMTGNVATFLADDETTVSRSDAVIVKVVDDLRSSDTKKFYEIVPGGFGEDALAYADRPAHEWNGLTKAGMPRYLIGADYVKTFSDDDMRADMTIRVWLSRPAKLFVIFDSRVKPPRWLKADFRKLKQTIGMDLGPWPEIGHPVDRGIGPGESIEHGFTIWKRVVKRPGVVMLGGNGTHDIVTGQRSNTPYMYGIAAVALDAAEEKQPAAADGERK